MAITLSSTKLTTATVNTAVSANFAGPVDFASAVISGEANKWQIVSADSNLSVNRNYFANTTGTGDATGIAMTLTLPASANVGDTITVIDQTANAQSNNVVIARNGNPIDGANRNVILNVQRGGVRLVYTGYGWTTKKVERETRFSGAQGESFGYSSQGLEAPTPTGNVFGQIEKYSFSVDGNGVDVGDLSTDREQGKGQSSLTHGYTGTGFVGPVLTGNVEKFPFATDGNATSVLTLFVPRGLPASQSSQTHGYTSGGYYAPLSFRDEIDKFPFATDANASDVGNLSTARFGGTGQSSLTHGYVSGGQNPPGKTNIIEKFPFATDTNAVDVGDLVEARNTGAGQNSEEFGYMSGGNPSSTHTDRIDRYPFASDTNATDIGNLTESRNNLSGSSSKVSGYSHGGAVPPGAPNRTDRIDKFPFASQNDATDVGNMFQKVASSAGHQY